MPLCRYKYSVPSFECVLSKNYHYLYLSLIRVGTFPDGSGKCKANKQTKNPGDEQLSSTQSHRINR